MSSNLRRPPVLRGDRVRILTPFSTGPAMSADVEEATGLVGTVRSEPDDDGDIRVEARNSVGVLRTFFVREWERVEDGPQPDPAVEALQARVEALEAAAQAVAEWKRTLVQAAHAVATERGWGSDFDDFMEEHGLPRRSKNFEALLEVTVKVAVQVIDAHDEEDALARARKILRTFPDRLGSGEVLSVENVAAYEV